MLSAPSVRRPPLLYINRFDRLVRGLPTWEAEVARARHAARLAEIAREIPHATIPQYRR